MPIMAADTSSGAKINPAPPAHPDFPYQPTELVKELVAALKVASAAVDGRIFPDVKAQIRAALAKAEGK